MLIIQIKWHFNKVWFKKSHIAWVIYANEPSNQILSDVVYGVSAAGQIPKGRYMSRLIESPSIQIMMYL